MIHPYSKEWDDALNKEMESNEFIILDRYTAQIGKYVVWIANQPYGSFNPYRPFGHGTIAIRPSRLTVEKAYRRISREIERQRQESLMALINDGNTETLLR